MNGRVAVAIGACGLFMLFFMGLGIYSLAGMRQVSMLQERGVRVQATVLEARDYGSGADYIKVSFIIPGKGEINTELSDSRDAQNISPGDGYMIIYDQENPEYAISASISGVGHHVAWIVFSGAFALLSLYGCFWSWRKGKNELPASIEPPTRDTGY